MARKTADMVVEKFRRRISGAGPDYRYGIENPIRPWVEGYAASSERMKQELSKALAEGRHLKGAREKGQQRWEQKVRAVGVDRFTGAATIAAENYAKVVSDIMSAAEAARSAASKLPNVTLEDRLNRAVAAMRAISEYWKRK